MNVTTKASKQIKTHLLHPNFYIFQALNHSLHSHPNSQALIPTTTMSLLLNPHQPSSLFISQKTPKSLPKSTKPHSLSFSPSPKLIFSVRSSINDPSDPSSKSENPPITDEWGEKADPRPEPASRFSGPDPPRDEDEWEGRSGNGTAQVADDKDEEGEKLLDMKRALVETVYGSNFGFQTSPEVRAEVLELVSQLEAANPTSAPTESPELLDGNWVLVYTAFSELLPLLAVSSIPTVKVEKISQYIDSSSLTIDNSITISSPFSSSSFSASASFEVRSPSRIQVQFKQGTFNPPEIKSSIDLPESINIFGQNINLSPVQQSLSPLQNVVEGISQTISGQPPLKISIPGERTKSWLLITYLDKDVRISRGDGGLFVLVREMSPLLALANY